MKGKNFAKKLEVKGLGRTVTGSITVTMTYNESDEGNGEGFHVVCAQIDGDDTLYKDYISSEEIVLKYLRKMELQILNKMTQIAGPAKPFLDQITELGFDAV